MTLITYSTGEVVPIKAGTRSMTIADVYSMRTRGDHRPQSSPLPDPGSSTDFAELGESADRQNYPNGSEWADALGIAFFTLLIGLAVLTSWLRKRRSAVVLLLAITPFIGGCVGATHPGPPLVGRFTEPYLLYDIGSGPVEGTLVVRNAGNRTLRLVSADGSCVCRQIDQSVFPRDLPSGGTIPIKVALTPEPSSMVQILHLKIQTDLGMISVNIFCRMLPRHQFNPDTVSVTLITPAGKEIPHEPEVPVGKGGIGPKPVRTAAPAA